MIEKILDNYYFKKFKKYIEDDILITFFIDKKIIKKKNRIQIWIKEEKYNDNEYHIIGDIDIKDTFIYFAIQEH